MEENFIELMKEVFEIDEVKFEDAFRDYDTWDSLTNISLIAMLDDEYEVIIDTKDFGNLETVRELYDEVNKRKA